MPNHQISPTVSDCLAFCLALGLLGLEFVSLSAALQREENIQHSQRNELREQVIVSDLRPFILQLLVSLPVNAELRSCLACTFFLYLPLRNCSFQEWWDSWVWRDLSLFCSMLVGCGARLAVGCLLETEVNRKSFKNKLYRAKFCSCLCLGNSTSTQG